jgi:hypothetical protein
MRGIEVFPAPPPISFAADSPKSDLFTTHHISLETRFTEVIGVIGDDLEGYRMTYVCCHNVYRSCHQGNYCPGQSDLAIPLLLSGLGAVLGRDVFFMSQTSSVSSCHLTPARFYTLMMTRRHVNSHTCRTVQIGLVTDEPQSVRKVDYLVRKRCTVRCSSLLG